MKKLFILFSLMLFATSLNGCGYNSMQANEEAVIAAWGDVEAAYQRRSDLVPNLVAVAREYAVHEKETLTAVTDARSSVERLSQTQTMSDKQAFAEFKKAQLEMGATLSRLMFVMEKYPDLKADQNFRTLQHQLEGTENRINIARVRYNSAVSTFNTSIRKFPNRLTNSFLLKLERTEPFKADPGTEKAPVVAKK